MPHESITPNGLTPTQIMLADLAGDIIGRGSSDAIAHQFVSAILQHSWRLRLHGCAEEVTRRYAESDLEDTVRRLARAWRDQPLETPTSAKEESASGLVRATMRARLASQMNDFINLATPEEGWILLDALESWHSHAAGHDAITCGLAEEMARALDRFDGLYIRVHPRHEKAVQAFVEQLHRADDEADRRAGLHQTRAA